MVDYEKLGELFDRCVGIAADDMNALKEIRDTLYKELTVMHFENAQLRKALAEVELILVGLSGGIESVADDCDIRGEPS